MVLNRSLPLLEVKDSLGELEPLTVKPEIFFHVDMRAHRRVRGGFIQ